MPEHRPEHEERGFLSRWSERKLAARGGENDEHPVPEPAEHAEPTATPQDPATRDADRAPALTDADMPPLESLDADSDYAGFLSKGVSESLRNAALKKLFFGGRFNLIDGLDDYAEDFTQFAPLGDIVTAEMRHRIEAAAKRIAESDDASKTRGSPEQALPPELGPEPGPDEDSDPEPETTADAKSRSESDGDQQTSDPGLDSGGIADAQPRAMGAGSAAALSPTPRVQPTCAPPTGARGTPAACGKNNRSQEQDA